MSRRNRDLVSAVIDVAAEYDMVAVGASEDYWLRRLFLRNDQSRIARHVELPVVLVRPHASLIGFSFRRFGAFIKGTISLEDDVELEKEGMLADGDEPAESRVNRGSLLAVGIAANLGAAAMVVGGGEALTWWWGAVFLAGLFAFTWISKRAVDRQIGVQYAAGSVK